MRHHGAHPEEHELADHLDGMCDELTRAYVTSHTATCRACTVLLGDASTRPAPTAPPLEGVAPRRLLPRSFVSALQDRTAGAPVAGQLWRVRSHRAGEDEAIEIVAIVTGDDGDALVAPVTADAPRLTDPWTVHLPLVGADAQLTYAVWLAVAHTIAIESLDVPLGSFDPAVLQAAHRAVRRGLGAPRGVVAGSAPEASIREYRQELAGALAIVAESGVDADELERSSEAAGRPAKDPAELELPVGVLGGDGLADDVRGPRPGEEVVVLVRVR